MIVTLVSRRTRDSSAGDNKLELSLICKHVELVRRVLDEAMADDSSGKLLQALLTDINGIARECYSCAAHFYKKQEFKITISLLTAAFEIAESYMEYVMCSPSKSASEIQKAHAELKIDAITSLLAFCFHEEKSISRARAFTGFSILYSSDVSDRMPLKAIGKYVSALFEELEVGQRDPQAMRGDFEAFVESIIHAFKTRGVHDKQIRQLIHGFRRYFDSTSSRLIEKMRASASSSEMDSSSRTSEARHVIEQVMAWADCEHFLSNLLLKIGEPSDGRGELVGVMNIPQALTARKVSYVALYSGTQSAVQAISELARARQLLSDAISSMQSSSVQCMSDSGGAHGWRGVISMEIILLSSYSNESRTEDECRALADISEEEVIKDVEACVRCWESVSLPDVTTASAAVFDAHGMTLCLEAVCNTLSLISCPFLESATRKLLEKIQRADDGREEVPSAWPPPSLELLNLHVDAAARERSDGEEMDVSGGTSLDLPSFQQIDDEIALSVQQHSLDDPQRAVGHLQHVMELLRELKTNGTNGGMSKAALLKTVGTRELLVHLILSEVHFSDGQGKMAVNEAKAALSICWKLSKKFTPASSPDTISHFTLPEEIRHPSGSSDGARSTSLIYFKALEFSSWDILHATKLVLCRIGTLYSLIGQPQR